MYIGLVLSNTADIFPYSFIVDVVEERLSRSEPSCAPGDLLSHIINEGHLNSAEIITCLTDLVFAAVDTVGIIHFFLSRLACQQNVFRYSINGCSKAFL